jgi:hypothetical protein
MGANVVDIEEQVCKDILRRQQLGIAKYGVTVENNPLVLREWLQHTYEELLDAAVYVRRSMAEIDRTQSDLNKWVREQLERTAFQ